MENEIQNRDNEIKEKNDEIKRLKEEIENQGENNKTEINKIQEQYNEQIIKERENQNGRKKRNIRKEKGIHD